MLRGPNGEVRLADMNQLAKCVVDLATRATSEKELERVAQAKSRPILVPKQSARVTHDT